MTLEWLGWSQIQAALDGLWQVVGTTLLHGTVLAALTALLSVTLLRRARPALLGALWTVVLIKFLVPLGPELPVSLSGLVDALWAGGEVAAPAAEGAVAASVGLAATHSLGEVIGLLLQLGLVLGYAALVLWGLGRQIRRHLALRAQAARLPDAGMIVAEEIDRAARHLRLRRVPSVRVSEAAASPYVIGLWRPVLVLPRWLLQDGGRALSAARREAALLHELAHLRRRDAWLRAVQVLAGALFWYWPVVRWVNRRIDVYRETACDQWAISYGPLGAADYARMLVAFARRRLEPAPNSASAMALVGRRHQIEQRVHALLGGRTRPGLGRLSAVALAAWALLSLGTTPGARAEARVNECAITPAMMAELLARFPEVDRDGDGVLTREEVCAQQEWILKALESSDPGANPAQAGAAIAAMEVAFDQDRDGTLSATDLATLKQQWDAEGWSDCAACGCADPQVSESAPAALSLENKFCPRIEETNQEK